MRIENLSKEKILRQYTADTNGTLYNVNENIFTFTNADQTFVIEKVDLGELFGDSCLDVSTLVPGEVIKGTSQEGSTIVSEGFPESVHTDDALGVHFCTWKRFMGIYDLGREEVDLNQFDNLLVIDASKATLYRGAVTVKIKE